MSSEKQRKEAPANAASASGLRVVVMRLIPVILLSMVMVSAGFAAVTPKLESPKPTAPKASVPKAVVPKAESPKIEEQGNEKLKVEDQKSEGPMAALSRMRGNMKRGEWDELLIGADSATIKRYEVALLVRLLADDGWKVTEDHQELLRDIANTSRRMYPPGRLFGRIIKEASGNAALRPLLPIRKEQVEPCFGPECPKDWYYVPDGAALFETSNRGESTPRKDTAHQIDLNEIRKTLVPPYQRYIDMRHWESYYACFKSPYDVAFAGLVALLGTRHENDIPSGLRPLFLEFARGEVSVDTFGLLMEQACVMPELFPLLTVRDDFLQSYPAAISRIPLIDPRPKPFMEFCRDLKLRK